MEKVQAVEPALRRVRLLIHGETREDVVKACEELRQSHRIIIAHQPQWRKSGWTVTADLLISAPA